MKDRDFLIWLHERLVIVHKEDECYDYMHKLRAIIENTPGDQETPNRASYNSLRELRKKLEEDKHKRCSCSTGIHQSLDADGSPGRLWGLTFGYGELDEHGYWQYPCYKCARRAEKDHGVPLNSYWPFDV